MPNKRVHNINILSTKSRLCGTQEQNNVLGYENTAIKWRKARDGGDISIALALMQRHRCLHPCRCHQRCHNVNIVPCAASHNIAAVKKLLVNWMSTDDTWSSTGDFRQQFLSLGVYHCLPYHRRSPAGAGVHRRGGPIFAGKPRPVRDCCCPASI